MTLTETIQQPASILIDVPILVSFYRFGLVVNGLKIMQLRCIGK
jgi:hypothetical protein